MKPVIAYVDDDLANLEFYKEILGESFTVEVFPRSLDLVKVLADKSFDDPGNSTNEFVFKTLF